MPKQATPAERKRARNLWELEGWSLRDIAREIGFSINGVTNWKKAEGWTRQEVEATVSTDHGDVQVVTEATVPFEAVVPAEEAAESETIAALQAKVAQLEQEKAELSDSVEIELPRTTEEWLAWFGQEHVEEVARTNLNRERRNRGFNPIEYESGDPVLVKEVEKTLQTFVNRQKSAAGESNLRTLKMAKRDPNNPSGWRIVAIPMEPTVNNFAAAPEEAFRRYLRKGFRLIEPAICQRGPCSAKAAVELGRTKYQGYCSEAHMNDDPFINANKVKGVTGTAQSMSARNPGTVIASAGG